MTIEREQLLADLLEQALESAVITNHYSKEQPHISRFRDALTRQWSRFVPDLNLYHPRNYKVTVQDEAVQKQLVYVVSSVLKDHTTEDRVQTAATATIGGYFQGYELVDLVERMVKVAIGKGSQPTAHAFYKDIRDQVATYRWIGLLHGIYLEHPIEVRPGISIAPLPSSTSELPPFFLQMKDMDPGDLLNRTVILINRTVAPIYADPELMNSPEELFHHDQTCTDLPDLNMEQFCDALALACDGPVERIADWYLHDPAEIFILNQAHAGNHRTYPNGILERTSVKATREQVEEAVSIYTTLGNLNEGANQKLRVPIKRWIKSKTNQSLVDSFIDLGIALESLYLDRSTEEIGFRLRLRAALFLTKSIEERESLMDDIKKIYALRSRAVHQGTIGNSNDTPQRATKRREENKNYFNKAQALCRQSIIKTIYHARETGQLPNWSRLEPVQLDEERTAE